MVSLTLLYSMDLFRNCKVDYYIGNQFVDAEKVTDKLRGLELVENVYCYGYFKGIFSKINSQIGKIIPRWALRRLTGRCNDFSYKYIFASLTTYFEMLICCANPDAKLFFFEDGIGNYISDFALSEPTRSIRLLKLFHKKVPSFIPSCLYLFQPQLIDRNHVAVEKVEHLLTCDSFFIKIIFSVFGVPEKKQKRSRLFYLQTPHEDIRNRKIKRNIIKTDSDIISVLEGYQDRCVVRPHPRQFEITGGNLELDDRRMWELKCADEIDDDSVILSFYSTAQFTPKIIYDKEPWIFFAYRLVFQNDTDTTAHMDEFIIKFKKIYSKPEKIIVLESIRELEKYLSEIMINKE